MVYAFTLWTFAQSFATNIHQLGENDQQDPGPQAHVKAYNLRKRRNIWGTVWMQIEREYRGLKDLSGLINHAIGNCVSLLLTEEIIYYAMDFDQLFPHESKTADWRDILSVAFFFTNTCIFLFFSASTCSQVREDNS